MNIATCVNVKFIKNDHQDKSQFDTHLYLLKTSQRNFKSNLKYFYSTYRQ